MSGRSRASRRGRIQARRGRRRVQNPLPSLAESGPRGELPPDQRSSSSRGPRSARQRLAALANRAGGSREASQAGPMPQPLAHGTPRRDRAADVDHAGTPPVPRQGGSVASNRPGQRHVEVPAAQQGWRQHQDERSQASGSTGGRKRHLELERARERAKIRKRAIEDQERIDLELLDLEYAAQVEELESVGEAPPAADIDEREARTREWINRQPSVPDQPRVTAEDEQPNRDVMNLSNVIVETLAAVRDAATGGGPSDRLVSRLSGTRTLPAFGGDCAQWLGFKRAFELSTELGHFTDKENVSRLRECLSGQAKESVVALLMGACTAQQIMSVLELRFGNPDEIMDRLEESIKGLPKIESGAVDLVTFATTVNNCVAAIKNYGE